jgi:hypothetical protein
MTDQLPEQTFLRMRAHAVRVAIELIAADAFDKATGSGFRQSRIADRLIVLTHDCSSFPWRDSYRVVRLARYTYKRPSDLLHGRSSMLSVSDPILEEWEAAVDELQRLHVDWLSCGTAVLAIPQDARNDRESQSGLI